MAGCLLLGCEPFGAKCEPATLFSPGTYASQGGQWVNGRDVFPHDTGTGKTLVIERDSEGKGTVRITYQRNGRTVIETWSLAPSYGQPVPWAP